MSFYNPYNKYPDVGQGFDDMLQQFMQIMMYKKYMDSMGGGQKQNYGNPKVGPPEPGPGDRQAMPFAEMPQGQPNQNAPGFPQGFEQNIDPAMMQRLSQMFQQAMLARNKPQQNMTTNPGWTPSIPGR